MPPLFSISFNPKRPLVPGQLKPLTSVHTPCQFFFVDVFPSFPSVNCYCFVMCSGPQKSWPQLPWLSYYASRDHNIWATVQRPLELYARGPSVLSGETVFDTCMTKFSTKSGLSKPFHTCQYHLPVHKQLLFGAIHAVEEPLWSWNREVEA